MFLPLWRPRSNEAIPGRVVLWGGELRVYLLGDSALCTFVHFVPTMLYLIAAPPQGSWYSVRSASEGSPRLRVELSVAEHSHCYKTGIQSQQGQEGWTGDR